MSCVLIANWKVNLDMKALENYCKEISISLPLLIDKNNDVQIVMAPSYLHLPYVRQQIINQELISLAAQDCSAFRDGPHTGDVSAAMLKEMGCSYVIIGHSERRLSYNENEELLAAKLECAYAEGLRPIYCIGEDFEARLANTFLPKLRQQIKDAGLDRLAKSKAIIAYEPIWSIGTGLTPTSDQITEVSNFIHELLPNQDIVYGGSVNHENAASILSLNHINGLLIGKASTDPEQFMQIIKATLNK